MLRILHARDGQASIEWMGAVALVLGVLVLAAAAAADRVYVGRAITRQMARALCIVRGGDCWRDKEPCVLDSKDERSGLTVHVFLVKIGGDRRALVEERSDGTVAVTEVHEGTLGVEAAAGAGFTFDAAGLDVEAGAQLEASIAARIGRGKTWIVGSLGAADQLVDDLEHHRSVRDPDAATSEDHVESGIQGSLNAEAAGQSLDAASAGFSGDRLAGSRVDRRTGHRTVYVQWSWDVSAAAGGGVLGAAHSAVGDVYGVELDASGRPIDLQVINAGNVADGLPDVTSPAARMLATRAAGSDDVYEVTSHLDLTERDNAELARPILDDVLNRKVPNGSAVQALRRRIDEQGTVEARILTAQATTGGAAVGAEVAGVHVGFDATSETKTLQLRAAASRGLDGGWLPRTDCVGQTA
ncbi:MAG TPA: hypothetical protein VFT50_08890 [Baekduia sp.]|nr:hypothetical protein [Baekduia sp.]